MLKLSITLPNSAQINLESEDSVVIDKILGTVLENVTRALLSASSPAEVSGTLPVQPAAPVPPLQAVANVEPVQATRPQREEPAPGSQHPSYHRTEPSGSEEDPAAIPGAAPAYAESIAFRQPPTVGSVEDPSALPDTEHVRGGPANNPDPGKTPDWVLGDGLGAFPDWPNGYPPSGGSHLGPSNLMPAVSEQAFIDFCKAANPLGDMRRVVVAAEGANRYLAMEGVDAEVLGSLFDTVGWPRAHNFVQTLRNAARSKFGWLERIPGRPGHYTVTNLGRATALGR